MREFAMGQLENMIIRCDRVLENPDDKEARMQLVNDYVIAYEMPVSKFTGLAIGLRGADRNNVSDSAVSMIKTSLVAYKEHLDYELELAKANGPSVTAQATSSSFAQVSMSQVIDMIEGDDGISEEAKADLQSLLAHAKKEAVKKDSGAFARIGAKVLEGVENATPGVVSGAIGILASMASAYLGR